MLNVLLCPEDERERLEALMKTHLAPFASEITIAQVNFCRLHLILDSVQHEYRHTHLHISNSHATHVLCR